MAKGDLELVVSVETVVHKELATLAQKIWNKYHIRLDEINVDWISCGTVAKPDFLVTTLQMKTTTK